MNLRQQYDEVFSLCRLMRSPRIPLQTTQWRDTKIEFFKSGEEVDGKVFENKCWKATDKKGNVHWYGSTQQAAYGIMTVCEELDLDSVLEPAN